MDPASRGLESLSGPAGSLLRAALDKDEPITHAVPAIGSVVVLTTRRLLILREGSSFRPKTGIREWPIDSRLVARPGLVRHGSGSVVITRDRDTASVFIQSAHWADALRLIGALRGRIRIEQEGRDTREREEKARPTDGD
jgi:hypothetical protein